MNRHYKIYYSLWTGGLFNRLMSFECAVGLQALLRQEVVLAINRHSKTIPTPPLSLPPSLLQSLDEKHHPTLEQLLDWPQSALYHSIDERIDAKRIPNAHLISLEQSYVRCREGAGAEDHIFADGRRGIVLDDSVNTIFHNTLCWYSRFFSQRPLSVDGALSKTRFQEPYHALALRIATSIGSFIGAHIRLSDFAELFYALSRQEIEEGLRSLVEGHALPLVVASDDSLHPLISELPVPYLSAEELILGEFRSDFCALPFHDVTALAIVSNLLLGHAVDFVGTPGSTFTGHIHRQLHVRDVCRWRFFGYPNGASLGSPPPKWLHQPVKPTAGNWWREWPNCKLR